MSDELRDGVTRRELFQIGNVLAMPVLLGGVRAHADGNREEGPLRAGPDIFQSIGVEPVPLISRVSHLHRRNYFGHLESVVSQRPDTKCGSVKRVLGAIPNVHNCC